MQIFEKKLKFYQRWRWKKAYYIFATYGWETGIIDWVRNSINPDDYVLKTSGREKLEYNSDKRERHPKEEKITVYLKTVEDGAKLVVAVQDAIRRQTEQKEVEKNGDKKQMTEVTLQNNTSLANDGNIDLTKRALEL